MTSLEGWHPEDIKAAIRKSGSTMLDVALAAGLHQSALSHCLKWPVPAANKAISDHLGVPLHELWPAWFYEDGEPKPRERKPSTERAAPQRKNSDAA